MEQWVQIGEDIAGRSAYDWAGRSVSLSSNGTIVAVGASWAQNVHSIRTGSVRVFRNDPRGHNNTWVQMGQDIFEDRFGARMSLSEDGEVVTVGIPWYANNDRGAVAVYQYTNDTWVQRGQTLLGQNSGDKFGGAVALAGDGKGLIIGATRNGSNEKGAAYLYQWLKKDAHSDFEWFLIKKYTGEAANDIFGSNVAISRDGNVVAANANWNDAGFPDSNSGLVRVYDFGWNSPKGNVIDAEIRGEHFGDSLSLSYDGDIVAAASHAQQAPVRVYQFKRSGFWDGSWVKLGEVIVSEPHYGGRSISLSGSGHIIAVGNEYLELVRIYRYSSDTKEWAVVGGDINGKCDEFGLAVSLSLDGRTLAVGGPSCDTNGEKSGVVRIFDMPEKYFEI